MNYYIFILYQYVFAPSLSKILRQHWLIICHFLLACQQGRLMKSPNDFLAYKVATAGVLVLQAGQSKLFPLFIYK